MLVHEVLRQAWLEVEKAELPEALHEVAFTHAFAMLSLGRVPAPVANTAQALTGRSAGSHDGPATAAGGRDPFEEFSLETGIERHTLESVFYREGDTVGISLRNHRLGKSKADQTRTVALLILCARYFLLGESEVSIEHVRAAAEDLKCYDSPNFSKTLDKVEGVNLTGPKGKKSLRFKPDTLEKFKFRVQALTASDAN